jgi:hypothetical protein
MFHQGATTKVVMKSPSNSSIAASARRYLKKKRLSIDLLPENPASPKCTGSVNRMILWP